MFLVEMELKMVKLMMKMKAFSSHMSSRGLISQPFQAHIPLKTDI